jgi:hypothetical protein
MQRVLAAVFLCAASVPAQSTPQGVAPDWDIKVILQEIASHAQRLLPMLDQIDVKPWIASGASETYAAQMQSLRDQVRSVAVQAKELAARPEKLSRALEIYFRLQGMDSMMRAVEGGVRKYQNPALADMLASVAREDSPNRERFQHYIVEMAVQREQEYAVMDHEAQRCRGILARQPVETKKGRK